VSLFYALVTLTCTEDFGDGIKLLTDF